MDIDVTIHEFETETSHEYRSGSRICTRVVGVTFDGRQAVVSRLHIGEEILLRRESVNIYDPNAIRAERIDGIQIGYLNRHLAALLAPLFDIRHEPVPASVYCLTGSLGSHYSLGVVILFNVP